MGQPTFLRYRPEHEAACMALFDANCPTYFAPNERADFAVFLGEIGSEYFVAIDGPHAVAAFAVMPGPSGHARLNWIMVAPDSQGSGIGRTMMSEAKNRAAALQAKVVDIAASHLSAPFFSRFGAREVGRHDHGWGPNMHRVDMEWPIRS